MCMNTEHMLGVHPHMPGLHRMKMVDRKCLKCRRVNCFGLYQVHIDFFLDCHVIAAYSNCLTQ